MPYPNREFVFAICVYPEHLNHVTSRLRILVHQRWRFEFGASIIEGVMDYAIQNTGWEIIPSGTEHAIPLREMRTLRVDGIIGDGFHMPTVEAATKLGLPFIDVTGAANESSIPSIQVDDGAVGAMAARCFLSRGIRSCGFVGFANHGYSRRRRDAFVAHMHEAGVTVDAWEQDFVADTVPVVEAELAEFVTRLPKPCGIFACSDLRAWSIVLACRHAGLSIPADVALLGVDNDQRLMRLMRSDLSSIDTGPFFIGWEAARAMHHWIDSARRPRQRTLIPPIQVVERASTRGRSSNNPTVKRFIDWAHAEGVRGAPVSEAATAVGCSRRNLEALCARHLGLSPHQYVMRLRMELALEKLAYSTASIGEIAESLGFDRQSDLTRLFQRLLGRPPNSLRRK